jgi:hexosaminidase
MGRVIAGNQFRDRVRLTDEGRRHLLGIQGQLWGENLRGARQLEYMAFPRLIALAERAWAKAPNWTTIDDRASRDDQLAQDWNRFANRLGQRELRRLDYLAGGVEYRIPPPGAKLRAGLVSANVALPGLTIRYTTDGSQPTATSTPYEGPIALQQEVMLRTFGTNGRGSRTVTITARSAD